MQEKEKGIWLCKSDPKICIFSSWCYHPLHSVCGGWCRNIHEHGGAARRPAKAAKDECCSGRKNIQVFSCHFHFLGYHWLYRVPCWQLLESDAQQVSGEKAEWNSIYDESKAIIVCFGPSLRPNAWIGQKRKTHTNTLRWGVQVKLNLPKSPYKAES